LRTKRVIRYRWMRGGLLAGAILSFIPAFALVRSGSTASAADDGAPLTSSALLESAGDDGQVSRYVSPFSSRYTSPSTSSVPVQPRTRTRAS
jgi:hypothetical protein